MDPVTATRGLTRQRRGCAPDEITTRVWWISRQRLFELYGQEE